MNKSNTGHSPWVPLHLRWLNSCNTLILKFSLYLFFSAFCHHLSRFKHQNYFVVLNQNIWFQVKMWPFTLLTIWFFFYKLNRRVSNQVVCYCPVILFVLTHIHALIYCFHYKRLIYLISTHTSSLKSPVDLTCMSLYLKLWSHRLRTLHLAPGPLTSWRKRASMVRKKSKPTSSPLTMSDVDLRLFSKAQWVGVMTTNPPNLTSTRPKRW